MNNFETNTNLDKVHHFTEEELESEIIIYGNISKYPKLNSEGKPVFDANANMPVNEEERKEMIAKVEEKFEEIFDILRISRNDPNCTNTPNRLAKMYVNELLIGRYDSAPTITAFPNRNNVENLIISKGIQVKSMCSHHWQPISGECAIGYIPDKHIIGLSKLTRIVEWFSRRGQIQEELGEQIADFIENLIQPHALGVVIKAKHFCMISRGVNGPEESIAITSVMRGYLLKDMNLRNEFLKLIDNKHS